MAAGVRARMAMWIIAGTVGLPPASAQTLAKRLHAVHITVSPPRIDGVLDDEIWSTAPTIDDFTQTEPDNLQAPTEHTVVQIAFDDRYVYVGVRCDVRDPRLARAGLGRRDNFPPSDTITIGFDPRRDRLTAYVFKANVSGVQGDFTYFDDTQQNNDYDGVWEVRTRLTATGWSAEFRIPFSQMRFSLPPAGPTTWGLQVRRDIQARGEFDEWVSTPRGQTGVVSRFGDLIFDDALTPPRRIEVVPYTLGQITADSGAKTLETASAGVDFRVGLGPSSTLSATVNPDFGQVEADPSVLNLSVFETFFPEKRPFFLEDSRTFVLNYGQFPDFYSRRIGQRPGRFALAANETLVSQPDNTRIIGALKFTGKASGWTYGALSALTEREYATVDRTVTGADGVDTTSRVQKLIEPMTGYNIARVQRDVLHGSSNVGLIATAVVRDKDLNAYAGGGDFNIRWLDNRYNVNGHWVATRAPIDEVMHGGFGGASNISYSGKYAGANGHYDHFSPNFHNEDLGFLTSRPNKNEVNSGAYIQQPDPWGVFRNVNFNVYGGSQWTDARLFFGKWFGTNLNLGFRNFWNVHIGSQHNFSRLDDLDTRGGPPIKEPVNDQFSFNVNSDSRKSWGVSLDLFGTTDRARGWNMTVGPGLRAQPSTATQLSLNVGYTFARDAAQWIENTDADSDGTVDNVYGRLRRNVVNITGRATYAFTRDLTLEAYVQPFVAVGRYTDIRKLARPSSFDFTPVALADDPDFNDKSVRGTIVLRWEYVRGSTLFFVWNLATSDNSRPGVFSPGRDIGRAFSAPGTNVFAIKLNYWLAP